jgi:hypothetical protein
MSTKEIEPHISPKSHPINSDLNSSSINIPGEAGEEGGGAGGGAEDQHPGRHADVSTNQTPTTGSRYISQLLNQFFSLDLNCLVMGRFFLDPPE